MKQMNRSKVLGLLVATAVLICFSGTIYAADASPYGVFTKEQYFKAKRIPPEKKRSNKRQETKVCWFQIFGPVRLVVPKPADFNAKSQRR